MPLLDQVQKEMVQAMKAREELRLSALRMLKAALQKHQVDTMKPLDDAAEMQVLNSLVKQRREAADQFRSGNRPDLADKEEAEMRLLESFLPAAPTTEEVAAAIDAAIAETGASGAKAMGAVMKAVQAKLAGKRVDNKAVSEQVKARLG